MRGRFLVALGGMWDLLTYAEYLFSKAKRLVPRATALHVSKNEVAEQGGPPAGSDYWIVFREVRPHGFEEQIFGVERQVCGKDRSD